MSQSAAPPSAIESPYAWLRLTVSLLLMTIGGSGMYSVTVVLPPAPPAQLQLGIHALRQGERLDHLAALYLSNPAGYWRIAEQNNVMLPEALTEAREIEIPVKAK